MEELSSKIGINLRNTKNNIASLKEKGLLKRAGPDKGGHNVPADDVKRRFSRGIINFFKLYEPIVDFWMMFDNSKQKPILIAMRKNGFKQVIDQKLFNAAVTFKG